MKRLWLVLALVACAESTTAPIATPRPTPRPQIRTACALTTVWGVNHTLWLLPPGTVMAVDSGSLELIRWAPTISVGTVVAVIPGDTVDLACEGDTPVINVLRSVN